MSDPMRQALMNDPAHWHHRAEHARADAEEITDPEAKRTLLAIAAQYEELAQLAVLRLISASPDFPGKR
jgi:hypothetical protein